MYGKFEWIDIEGELIKDASCTCEDFVFRRIESKDGKTRAKSLCKHLKRLIAIYHPKKEVKLDGISTNNIN